MPLLAARRTRAPRSYRSRPGGLGARIGRRAHVASASRSRAALALAAFLSRTRTALLDYTRFHAELVHQSTLSAEAQGKLGAPNARAASSTTCGRSPGGSAGCRRWRRSAARCASGARRPALGWLLVPAPLLFLVFMGLQGRYFGRWLLPIFPLVCLLAAFFAL